MLYQPVSVRLQVKMEGQARTPAFVRLLKSAIGFALHGELSQRY